MMPCPIPNCIDCEAHAVLCPVKSRHLNDLVCWERGETGSCQHQVTVYEEIRKRRNAEKVSRLG